MNSKTKKITTLVVSTVAVIATVIIFLISTPVYSAGETVETTNSVATTTGTITTQIMIETTTSTTEIITTTTEETIAVVTTEQTTTFTIETQKPTTETILDITKPVITTTSIIPVIMEEYVIYKPATHYIHMNTCRWAESGDVYRIENTEGIEARKCSECNPPMEIIAEYIEPVPEPGELTYVKPVTRGT